MKKLLLSFTALFCSLTFLKAAEGDTTSIQSQQATHWSWYGNYYDTVQFPQTGTYRKIIMYYTLGCPSIGCSEWDYTTKIEVSDPLTDSTNRWVELTKEEFDSDLDGHIVYKKQAFFTRHMPAQDVTELVEALENLARLGNGEHYGNSDGNMIARTALSKYKGAR